MPGNSEAIFGTRPFSIYGEGPPDPVATGNFNESKGRAYTAEDMRFTIKEGRLYAIVLGPPADGKVRIKTLAKGSSALPGEITKVEALAPMASLTFERTTAALVVTLPPGRPSDLAFALRITPSRLPA